MSEETRKLASIRVVDSLEPIDGADKIELAKVGGWQVVTQKGWASPRKLVIFFEVDSFLPVDPRFEFLRKSGFKSTKNLGDGFRLKTIKLRKTLSQGLIMPLEEFPEVLEASDGLDVTELLKVQKYEKPIPASMTGRVRGNYPMFIRKTDQERAQNMLKEIKNEIGGLLFEVSLKLDGSSMTVYRNEDYTGVCSRNWDLDQNEELSERRDVFWTCANLHNLPGIVERMQMDLGRNLALQGELMGPGVQGNREKLNQLEFYLFDIWDIDKQAYVSPDERHYLAKAYNLQQVPMIGFYYLQDILKEDSIIDDLQTLSDRSSINNDVRAEGLVFKRVSLERMSFKIINNQFLLENDE